MRLKLDENLGETIAQLFREAGHEVETVASQKLYGIDDRALIEICRQERRCLISLDTDFANPLLFRPSDYNGIVVLRLPAQPTLEDIKALARTLIEGLRRHRVEGELWIVQKGRIRIYREETDGGADSPS